MRLPVWIRAKQRHSDLRGLKSTLREYGLSTVCEEARCPNKAECFSKPTATFMLLGSRCTRNCGFCSVESAAPHPPEDDEPLRVAMAAKKMGLKYAVLTSVTRDDLEDGGAKHFALTVKALKNELPCIKVEVLTPDFRGNKEAIRIVLDSRPDVFNHNVETVPRLYEEVRPQADYRRSIELLREVKKNSPAMATKSGLMLGLGEMYGEVLSVLSDLRGAGCDFLTIGQYLRPSLKNLPVKEYVPPEVFESLKETALEMGFGFVASYPLARSSMNAEEMFESREGVGYV